MIATGHNQRQRGEELKELPGRSDRAGVDSLTVGEVKRLCRLFRHITIDLSRARTEGDDPELVRYLNFLAARAHGRVYRARRVDLRPVFGFVSRGFPRLVRRNARPLLAAAA